MQGTGGDQAGGGNERGRQVPASTILIGGGASVVGDATELYVIDARLASGVHDVDQGPRR